MQVKRVETELRDLIKVLRKWMWLIVALTLLAGAVAALVSVYILDEIYEATAVMIISSTKDDPEVSVLTYNEYSLNIKLVNTYRELAKTDRVLDQVIDSLGLDLTPAALMDKISISSAADTEIIRFSVQDTNPALARHMANTLAQIFVREVPQLVKMDNVQIIDEAKLPTQPIRPRTMVNIAVSLVLGLMAGAGIAFLTEILDKSIKTVDQLVSLTDLPVLGTVPQLNENDLEVIR